MVWLESDSQSKDVASAFHVHDAEPAKLPFPSNRPANQVASRTNRAAVESGGSGEIIGRSALLKKVLELVETVAPADATVLIEGETGTGKELIAKAIHEQSARRERPFVKLNCAAIPAGLIESELFGHERGAFTGAVTRRIGRFEAADGGTLFLDEIGDLSLDLQVKLLRVLQESEFERLGSTQPRRVNVRLVAATNHCLAQLVSEHRFRSDLFYRLNVFPIVVPPLRERIEDIPLLVRHFAQKFAKGLNKPIDGVPQDVMNILVERAWPGNIRELQNLVERCVILARGGELRPPSEILRGRAEIGSPEPVTLEDAERHHIQNTLRLTNGVISGPNGAAVRLGLKRATPYFRMQKLGIARGAL
jgi:formate hydrogenlyase transcriptional activator